MALLFYNILNIGCYLETKVDNDFTIKYKDEKNNNGIYR
jgi:hypothetical protein